MEKAKICYRKKEFIILRENKGFIVYNTNKPFSEGHTHLNNFKASKDAISFVINKKIPRDKSYYYLTSLMRISNNKSYIKTINEILISKKNKTKQNYFNSRKKK